MEIAIIVKPELINCGDEVLEEFDSLEGKRIDSEVLSFTLPLIEGFYGHLKNHSKKFYSAMQKDLLHKPALFAIYEGDVGNFLRMKFDIRTRFAHKITQLHNLENYVRNGVHCSDSFEAGVEESKLVRDFIGRFRA